MFSDNCIEITKFANVKRLTGVPFIENDFGYGNMNLVNQYFVLFSGRLDKFFYIYNSQGDSLGCFGDKGQGPDDLIAPMYCGQCYNATMWINDIGKAKLCAINIEKSLIERKCVFEKRANTVSYAYKALLYHDSIVIAEELAIDNYYMIKKNAHNDSIISRVGIYKYPVGRDKDVQQTYQSYWRMKPDESKLVFAMRHTNMINIMDLTDNSRVSLIINPPAVTVENISDPVTVLPYWRYYRMLFVTDNNIYALYLNQAYEDEDEIEKEVEIHVFDWQYNALHKYIVSEYLRDISVDEENGYIYGFRHGLGENEKDIVYRYEM
jgi:hypothetical protein